jgi:hypothetical protein
MDLDFDKYKAQQFCDNPDCDEYGKVGANNISNRSGCKNLGLAIMFPSSVPCRHGNTGSLNTRHLGADPARSAGLYSDARIASVGLGSERASFAGAKRYVTRVTGPDFAQLLASAVERPAPKSAIASAA